jgi:hypothetical protein
MDVVKKWADMVHCRPVDLGKSFARRLRNLEITIVNEALEEVLAVLAVEDIDGDPDDLYTGRFHRLNRIRAMKRSPEPQPSCDD